MAISSGYNHPSLVLGNIADIKVVGYLNQIDHCRSQMEAAQDKLNALLMCKRSITMTLNELMEMSIDTSTVADKLQQIDNSLMEAANAYLTVKLENEEKIAQIQQVLGSIDITGGPESPIDFGTSKLEPRPYFCESMKLDSQYFSFGSNLENDKLAEIEKFIRSNTSAMGDKSNDITKTACAQISNQLKNHNLCGTLIITASCTHRNIHVFAPLVLDPDKAVNVWNTVHPDKIDLPAFQTAGSPVPNIAALSGNDDAASFIPLITGAAYGSSFVGMVHILQSDTSLTGDMDQLKSQLDKKLKIGGWLENATGGFGVNPDLFNEVKAFLSAQSISSHVSIITMGSIPAIKSHELAMSVECLSQPGPDVISGILSQSIPTNATTVKSEADEANRKAMLANVENARIKEMVMAMGTIDHKNNSVLDVNSLMQAFENYVTLINQKDQVTGVPVHFYIRNITRQEIIEQWLKKYYPPEKI